MLKTQMKSLSKNTWMWHLDLWLHGERGSAGLTAELYFRGLFQPEGFYDL